MNLFHDTVDLDIDLDPSTRLPLLSEEQKILDLIINYLQLPYSVAEYGCGNKCSMIISKLYDLGIPSYAIKRGMIMEKDMSDEALAERDFKKRIHSLTIENTLFHKIDFSNEIQLQLFEEAGLKPDSNNANIQAGKFLLSNDKTLQFIEARSHIFTIILFWDEKNQCVKERVIDPTIDSDDLFMVTQLRKYLQASESLLFTAPLMGEFQLDEKYLTEDHVKEYYTYIADREPNKLSRFDSHQVVRKMNGASKGSVGDPLTWTYANNMPLVDQKHHEFQLYNTGMGNHFSVLIDDMIYARQNRLEERVVKLINEINNLEFRLNIPEIIKSDCDLSEKNLESLIDLVNTVSNHTALKELYERIQNGQSLAKAMTYHRGVGMNRLFGISFRIRERLEELANVSRNEKGQIDALALSSLYTKAVKNCIGQMNKAGMQVFIDAVGNLHGLFVSEEAAQELKNSPEKLSQLAKNSLAFCSHIDTVSDGGKFDGRLGVITGIELVHLLNDLQRFYNLTYKYPDTENTLMVSVFTGEEMYFTGMSVSMPGSSAVAGLATPEAIYQMSNQRGEIYKDCLLNMLDELRISSENKELAVVNGFTENNLLAGCFNPSLFYTQHTFERHIEQGSQLHNKKVPLVLVDTIMGIHQQDFIIEGPKAELAALLLNIELRRLSQQEDFSNNRVTCGSVKHLHQLTEDPKPVSYGMRWNIIGQKNHAGSTAYYERKDAGVAIARLVEFFTQLVEELNIEDEQNNLSAIIGAPNFVPGTNRNVIPGEASVTLAVNGDFSNEIKNVLMQKCLGFITGTLALDFVNGGEGITGYNVHEVNYINISENVNISLDVRFPDTDIKNELLNEIRKMCKVLQEKYSVHITPIIEQELAPSHLKQSGQVLQIERSYGGSHNPNETELTRDVLRGSLLQLNTAIDFIKEQTTDQINLYQFVKKYIPPKWIETIPSFVSGALHDTCNIATSASRTS